MFWIALKKLINNKLLSLCLAVGLIIVIALLSSISLYSNSILQKMLIQDLDLFQRNEQLYPGLFAVQSSYQLKFSPDEIGKTYQYFDRTIRAYFSTGRILPVLSFNLMKRLIPLVGYNEDQYQLYTKTGDPAVKNTIVELVTLSAMEDHIKITQQADLDQQAPLNYYPALIAKQTANGLGLLPGSKLYLPLPYTDRVIPLIITGIFEPADYKDLYWQGTFKDLGRRVFIQEEDFEKEFIGTDSSFLAESVWTYCFDYHKLSVDSIVGVLEFYKYLQRWAGQYPGVIDYQFYLKDILVKYIERARSLKISLLIMTIPVLVVLFFYISMISGLILQTDMHNTAVLKSRGASRYQLLLLFFLQSLTLGLIALLLGPLIGIGICSVIGSTNGFLEFISRSTLTINMKPEVLLYALIGTLFLIVTMIIPANRISQLSIVQLIHNRGAQGKQSLWRRIFLDIILLVIAVLGLISYRMKSQLLNFIISQTFDPLLFFISILFILGLVLLFLRVFPHLINLVKKVGFKRWPAHFYAAIIRLQRANQGEFFLILFISLAVAVGIFSSNTARTINKNLTDKIYYATGADIVLHPYWFKRVDLSAESIARIVDEGEAGDSAGGSAAYIMEEPPFTPYESLTGVEAVTKVLVESGEVWVGGNRVTNVEIMGIEPEGFGHVAWFRPGLLPVHWYNFLNLLTKSKSGLLVSRNFQNEPYNLKPMDNIQIELDGERSNSSMVLGFIDYWPTYNPYLDSDSTDEPRFLIVGHLQFFTNNFTIRPYQVWLKKLQNSLESAIYKELADKQIRLESFESAKQKLITLKKDPLVLGLNGALTINFLIIIFIMTIGYLIYWILSLINRKLQLGVVRAMGLSAAEVTVMLVFEQLFISVFALIAGFITGELTSYLFIPLLQYVHKVSDQVPPFVIVSDKSDYLKIIVIMTILLITCSFVIHFIVSKLKVNQALKLGEE